MTFMRKSEEALLLLKSVQIQNSEITKFVSSSCQKIMNVKGYEALLLFCSSALGGGLVSERSQST